MNFYQKIKHSLGQSLTKTSVKWIIFSISIFLLFTVIGPNLEWVRSPLIPKIHGKVVDDVTGKPIQGIQVLISHYIRYVYIPGAGYTNYNKSVLVITDDNGEFRLNRTLKPISFSLFGIFSRDYDGTYAITLNNKYEYIITKSPLDGNVLIRLARTSTIRGIIDNYKVYELFEGCNYPPEIKSIITKHKNEAAVMLKLNKSNLDK